MLQDLFHEYNYWMSLLFQFLHSQHNRFALLCFLYHYMLCKTSGHHKFDSQYMDHSLHISNMLLLVCFRGQSICMCIAKHCKNHDYRKQSSKNPKSIRPWSVDHVKVLPHIFCPNPPTCPDMIQCYRGMCPEPLQELQVG